MNHYELYYPVPRGPQIASIFASNMDDARAMINRGSIGPLTCIPAGEYYALADEGGRPENWSAWGQKPLTAEQRESAFVAGPSLSRTR